jgi:drug/metabolite transporter (DMT)-like permease
MPYVGDVQMLVRLLRTTETNSVMILYLMMCTMLYSSIGCLLTWKDLMRPSTLFETALLVGQGLLGYGNQICITTGLRNGRAASVMNMQYLSIVVSQLLGMLVFHEFTGALALLGMLVVVASMVLFVWCESLAQDAGQERSSSSSRSTHGALLTWARPPRRQTVY